MPTAPPARSAAEPAPPPASPPALLAPVLKPVLRGWFHLGASPLALAAGTVLVVLAPAGAVRWASAVFAVSATMLFATSALYHRGSWSPRWALRLKRLDHSNIFLIIAGTYTPLAVALLPVASAERLLWAVWVGAGAGVAFRVLWTGAPRWLYTPLYVLMGLAAVGWLPAFGRSGGGAVLVLVAAGGLAYALGAVVYGTKRPDPSPRWFGFHEIFHALTVLGFSAHVTAIFLAVLGQGTGSVTG